MCARDRLWLIVVMLAGALSVTPVAANDSAISDISGGTVQPMNEHPSIRMVSENVDIELGEKVGWEWPVFVRCEFHLRNEGPATGAVIGFPEKATWGGDAGPGDKLKGFKSWVDGKQVEVKYTPSSQNSKEPDATEYKAWYVKKVHFDKGQTRRIVDVYSARLGTSNTAGEPTYYLLSYILRTGANWKGNIGKAVIRADMTRIGQTYRVEADSKDCVVKDNIYTWTFRDFEPKADIRIELAPRTPTLNGKEVPSYFWEPLFERNGVVMSSVRFLGAFHENYKNRLELRVGRHVLVVTAGSRSAVLDGKKITLKTAPWIQSQYRTDYAVPLEETVRLLSGEVKRDAKGRMNVVLKGLQ